MKKIFLTSVLCVTAVLAFSQVPDKNTPQLASAEKKDTVSTAPNSQVPSLGNAAPVLQNGQGSQKAEQPVTTPVLSEATDPKRK